MFSDLITNITTTMAIITGLNNGNLILLYMILPASKATNESIIEKQENLSILSPQKPPL